MLVLEVGLLGSGVGGLGHLVREGLMELLGEQEGEGLGRMVVELVLEEGELEVGLGHLGLEQEEGLLELEGDPLEEDHLAVGEEVGGEIGDDDHELDGNSVFVALLDDSRSVEYDTLGYITVHCTYNV